MRTLISRFVYYWCVNMDIAHELSSGKQWLGFRYTDAERAKIHETGSAARLSEAIVFFAITALVFLIAAGVLSFLGMTWLSGFVRAMDIPQANTPPELFFGFMGVLLAVALGVVFPAACAIAAHITGAIYQRGRLSDDEFAWAAQFAQKVLGQFRRVALTWGFLFAVVMALSVRVFPEKSVVWGLLSLAGGAAAVLLFIVLAFIMLTRFLENLARK